MDGEALGVAIGLMVDGQDVLAGFELDGHRRRSLPHSHGVWELESDRLIGTIGDDHQILLPARSTDLACLEGVLPFG